MLTIGDRLPAFKLQAVVSTEKGKEFTEITEKSHPGQYSRFVALVRRMRRRVERGS